MYRPLLSLLSEVAVQPTVSAKPCALSIMCVEFWGNFKKSRHQFCVKHEWRLVAGAVRLLFHRSHVSGSFPGWRRPRGVCR